MTPKYLGPLVLSLIVTCVIFVSCGDEGEVVTPEPPVPQQPSPGEQMPEPPAQQQPQPVEQQPQPQPEPPQVEQMPQPQPERATGCPSGTA